MNGYITILCRRACISSLLYFKKLSCNVIILFIETCSCYTGNSHAITACDNRKLLVCGKLFLHEIECDYMYICWMWGIRARVCYCCWVRTIWCKNYMSERAAGCLWSKLWRLLKQELAREKWKEDAHCLDMMDSCYRQETCRLLINDHGIFESQ